MKTVIEMAREAGLFTHKEVQPELERFAALVRADERKKWEDQTAVEINEAVLDERKACANVCYYQSKEFGGVAEGPFVTDFGKHTQMSMAAGAENCAAAIRARGIA